LKALVEPPSAQVVIQRWQPLRILIAEDNSVNARVCTLIQI
jgi:hypothetical protein